MLVALHHPPDVRVKLPKMEPGPFMNFVKAKKEGILKIPADVSATPRVMGRIRIEPREKHGSNSEMPPFNVSAEVHSSVNSGCLKQFSTLLTNFMDW